MGADALDDLATLLAAALEEQKQRTNV